MRTLAIGGAALAFFAYTTIFDSYDPAAPKSKVITQQSIHRPVTVDKGDPDMAAAREKARASLEEFFTLAANPKPGTAHHAVKLPIAEGENTEVFWISKFKVEGDFVRGILDNKPHLVKNVRVGQEITFQKSEIVDWMYMDQTNKKLVGNFSACAMLKKAPPAERETFIKRYGLDCTL